MDTTRTRLLPHWALPAGPRRSGEEMIEAGATAFRLNTSHLTLEQLHRWLESLDVFFATAYQTASGGAGSAGQQMAAGGFPSRRIERRGAY